MRLLSISLLLSMTLACAGGDGDTTADTENSDTNATETGEVGPSGPMATGTIAMRDPEMGLSADVELWRAFSYYTDDTTLVYATSSADATCDDVATMLIGKKEVDPNDIFESNSCNLVLQSTFKPNRPNYDIQTDEGAIATIYCAYGEGEWTWEDGWKGERWYWSGEYYTASAWKGTLGLTEGENQSVNAPIELREYEGNFPLNEEGSAEEHKASGKLMGTLVTEHCEKLKNTSWF